MQKNIVAIGIITLFILSMVSPIVFGNTIKLSNKEVLHSSSGDGGLMNSSWPMFGQNVRHTGLSSFGKSGTWYVEKWNVGIGSWASSSPAIDNEGTIYIGGGVQDESIHAIYPNGTKKWSFETNGHVQSSPAIAENGTIYFGSNDGKLYALNPNGNQKWSLTIGDAWVVSSPVIDDEGIIYIASTGGKNICAVYPNGTKKWDYITGSDVYSSPVLDNMGTVYCGSHDGYMHALYKSNGTLKWKYGTGTYCGGKGATVGDDGTIYFGDLLGYLHAVNPNGTRKWRKDLLNNIVTSPAIAEDGSIIVGCYRGYMYSFNPDNGSENWRFEVEKYEWIPSSPAIDKFGIIYFGANNGWFYALNPDGTYRWSFKTLDEIYTSPAIGEDGTIYIAAHSVSFSAKLYALEPIEGNSPPEKPSVEGPTNIQYFLKYTYNAVTTDPDGDKISYYFDWGDDTSSGWTEFVSSGISKSLTHSWSRMNVDKSFVIKVKAKDEHGAWSDWGRLKISISLPRNRFITNTLLLNFLERFPMFNILVKNLF